MKKDSDPEAEQLVAHYDNVASSFLSVSATVLAIIVGLFPIIEAQKTLNAANLLETQISVILLGGAIILDVLSLLDRKMKNYSRKRILARASAVPLLLSIVVLLLIVLR